jgi:hypothetical protein
MTITLEGPARVVDYLKMKDQFSIQMGCAAPADWAYRTYEGMVLDLGQSFERKPLPPTFRKMRARHCYGNALRCVLRDGGDQYRYVEGYAAGVIVTEHAWVLDMEDGKIFDPTWPRNDRHGPYYGIVFPTEFAWRHTLDTGEYGLLAGDWLNENHLLRNGRSAWTDFEEAR